MTVKWVATTLTIDEDGSQHAFHLEGSKEHIDYMVKMVPDAGWVITAKGSAWKCDGRDNCLEDA